LEQASRAYGELRSDENAWAAEQAERKVWDKTLKDGFEKE